MRGICKKTQWTAILPALILILGAALRLAWLGSVPEGMHQDEAFVAWNAYALYEDGMDSAGNVNPVYLADWGDGHSALYSWLLLPILALTGGELSPFLSRLPQAAVALLTLWAVYCLLKRMFNRTMGLWGMFLLAVCPWHIMMSRWGLDANLAPGFLIFGLYFFIRGLEERRFFLLSAAAYGLSLYCYAVIWPLVPVLILLQAAYGIYHKKISLNRWTVGSAVLLFVMALPLLLFVMVNSGVISPVRLPFLTVPKMGGYRGGELAVSFRAMWSNLRRTISLLWHQNIGAPYDILLPYGLFYDIGRVLIVIGFFCLAVKLVHKLMKKEFTYEYFLFVQLVGAGLVCCLVAAVLHQVNCLFIPLVICEAYGVYTVWQVLASRRIALARGAAAAVTAAFLLCLVFFQRDYYTQYRELSGAYFGAGVEQAVEYAMGQGRDIVVEKGAQWPRLLLFSETTPEEYLESVKYAKAPAPASFRNDNTTFHIGIDKKKVKKDSVYILYYTDKQLFENGFHLKKFEDWYVAVPKKVRK